MNILLILILLSNLRKIWTQDVNYVPSVEVEPLRADTESKLAILDLLKKSNDMNKPVGGATGGVVMSGDPSRRGEVNIYKDYGLPFECGNVATNLPLHLFQSDHRLAVLRLMEYFTSAGSLENMVRLGQEVRRFLNPYLFQAAFTNVLMNMNIDIELPAVCAMFPEDYVTGVCLETIERESKNINDGKKKKRQVNIKDGKKKKRQVEQSTVRVQRLWNGEYLITQIMDLSGTSPLPENRVAYFREDYGMNSHHYNWHLVFTNIAPIPRRNEYFFYMHSQMLRRYNIERLSVGLPRVETYYNFENPIEVGHMPNLGSTNIQYGIRYDYSRPVSYANIRPQYEKLREISSILRQESVNDDNRFMELVEEYHNDGHMSLARTVAFGRNMNVMATTQVAARDNVFYRWHQHIDDIHEYYQEIKRRVTNTQLTYDELAFRDIRVTRAAVENGNGNDLNVIYTGCGYHQVDISNGLNFVGTRARVNMIHLDHVDYTYHITLENLANQRRSGVVRIFIAPQINEFGHIMDIEQQRNYWIEMDKFMYIFTPGINNIWRSAQNSTVAVDCRDSFDDAAEKIFAGAAETRFGHCGCGWPQHLLVPRGTPNGMNFNLFVIITNEPYVREWRLARSTYCGRTNYELSDDRPMGFPFHAPAPGNHQYINGFSNSLPNAIVSEISIRFTGGRTNFWEEPVEGCGR